MLDDEEEAEEERGGSDSGSQRAITLRRLQKVMEELRARLTMEEMQGLTAELQASARRSRALAASVRKGQTGSEGMDPGQASEELAFDPVRVSATPRKLQSSLSVAVPRPGARVMGRILAHVSVTLLRWRPMAEAIAWLLRFPVAAKALKPFYTHHFLRALLWHPSSVPSITKFLRARAAPAGVAQLLRFHFVLAHVCQEPGIAQQCSAYVGVKGLGRFLRNFLIVADPADLARLLRHYSTATVFASVIEGVDPLDAAAFVHQRPAALSRAIARICRQKGTEMWAVRFVRRSGMEKWVAGLLRDPRGAVFARRVLLSPGFMGWVDAFLLSQDAKAFVVRLLQQPGVTNFVTWLSRDIAMRRWFARLAVKDNPMQFITEMLLEPGLDKFMVGLLLKRGNDAALKAMLEHWVVKEGSILEIVKAFAEKPQASQALAKVLISPGFMDRFVLQRLLFQPGLAEVVLQAVVVLGALGLYETILPLALSTLSIVFAMSAETAKPAADQVVAVLEEQTFLEQLLGIIAILLGPF